MPNRIRHLRIRNHSLVGARAEVHVTVVPEYQTPATEVRGRLMGPSCPYASTIEVAYHLRPLTSPHATQAPSASAGTPTQAPSASAGTPTQEVGLTVRAIIPEASLWEPECPFLYRGPVELWQDGQRCDQVSVRHGLRTLQLGSRGGQCAQRRLQSAATTPPAARWRNSRRT